MKARCICCQARIRCQLALGSRCRRLPLQLLASGVPRGRLCVLVPLWVPEWRPAGRHSGSRCMAVQPRQPVLLWPAPWPRPMVRRRGGCSMVWGLSRWSRRNNLFDSGCRCMASVQTFRQRMPMQPFRQRMPMQGLGAGLSAADADAALGAALSAADADAGPRRSPFGSGCRCMPLLRLKPARPQCSLSGRRCRCRAPGLLVQPFRQAMPLQAMELQVPP